MNRLLRSGYVVLHQVDEEALQDIDAIASDPSLKWVPVFIRAGVYDDFRIQAKLTVPMIQQLKTKLNQFFMLHFPNAKPKEWNFLKSLPGGPDQAPHRDYPLVIRNNHDFANAKQPGSMIVALCDNTVLDCYGWNRIVADEARQETHNSQAWRCSSFSRRLDS